MEYKRIKSIKLPAIGIGTWGMGGWMTKDTCYDDECVYAIRNAIRLGMTHIDTAEVYGNGHAEEIVAKAIHGINREKVFITSKVYKNHLHYNDVINSARNSLRRLRINYIDLYLVHWPNPKIPLKETMKAMDYLVQKGIVKHIGVSNFSAKLLEEAQSYTKNKIAANQVEYNLLRRNPEKGLLKYCQENGIFLIAYQPLAGGKLAKPGYKVLDDTASKYKKTPSQTAISWLIAKDNVVAIPKASNAKHVRENALAAGWRMTKEDMARLEKYFWKFSVTSRVLGAPLRLAKNTVISVLPEKQAEKLVLFYDKTIKKFSRVQKKVIAK